jgi:hypothetical protein
MLILYSSPYGTIGMLDKQAKSAFYEESKKFLLKDYLAEIKATYWEW